jgi:hypothetical protein
MKLSDELYTKRISATKEHRLQDVPMETRDIKQDRLKVKVVKRKQNEKA